MQTVCAIVADMRKETKNITLSAAFTALSVLFAFLSSAFPTMSLTILAISGVVSAFALSECGYKYACLTYLAVSVISAFLVPDKTCVAFYVLLFGHYPIVKTLIERVGNRWLSWGIKLLLINALGALIFYLTTSILTPSGDFSLDGGKFIIIVYNLAVILYDLCIGKLMFIYLSRRGRRG